MHLPEADPKNVIPSHYTWGHTERQQIELQKLREIPGFKQLVEPNNGYDKPMNSYRPTDTRKPHWFMQIVVTTDGAYHSFKLYCNRPAKHICSVAPGSKS